MDMTVPVVHIDCFRSSFDDGSGLAFPSDQQCGRRLSNVAMMNLLEKNGVAECMTVHGCRASLWRWSTERTARSATGRPPPAYRFAA